MSTRARYGSSFNKKGGGPISRKDSGYNDKERGDKDRDVEMHDGTSNATSAMTLANHPPAPPRPAPGSASMVAENEEEGAKEPEEDEKSIEQKLAERRRRRAEILAKHASGQSSTAVGLPVTNGTGAPARPTPGTIVSEALAKVTMMDENGTCLF